MAFSYLTEENIYELYKAAKEYTEGLTEKFPEWERIAENRPRDDVNPRYPKVTDGTTASIVRKTPKRIIQQIPDGTVTSETEDEALNIFAQFTLRQRIIPNANLDYDLLQKSWVAMEKAMTVGSQTVYTPFVNHDGEYTPDFKILHHGDVSMQPGKASGYSSNYVFVRSWYQPEDIEALIKTEKERIAESKKDGETYESLWNLETLEKIKTAKTQKEDNAKTHDEKTRNNNGSETAIQLVTGFQVGVGNEFFTFNPGIEEIARKRKNPDPRGKMPLDWLYCDIDAFNPLGRGVVALIAGLQNLIDGDMQMYQFNRALMLMPPVLKRGNVSANKIVYEPNRIIDLGSDPNASVTPLNIDTTAVREYPNLYGLLKSQMLNLVPSPDTSISSEVGNPGFSRTPAGIREMRNNISVDDNHLRRMYEAFEQNWAETALNIHFAERRGEDTVQLDKETADKIRDLASEGKLENSFVSEPDELNRVVVDYDVAPPILRFRVDSSSSRVSTQQDQLEALERLVGLVGSTPLAAETVPRESWLHLWNAIINNSGLEDTGDIRLSHEQIQQIAQSMITEEKELSQIEGETPPEEAQPEEPVEPPLEEPEIPEQDPGEELAGQLVEEYTNIAERLTHAGVPEDDILEAFELLQEGYEPDEVFDAIQRKLEEVA